MAATAAIDVRFAMRDFIPTPGKSGGVCRRGALRGRPVAVRGWRSTLPAMLPSPVIAL